MSSCVLEEEDDLLTTQHEVVFKDLNVDQPRGHFAYTDAELANRLKIQQSASAGLASRSSGTVKIKTCAKANFTGKEVTLGSGALTSSTRFTTALHNVFTKKDEDSIRVFFGTVTGKKNGNLNSTGKYVADNKDNISNLQFNGRSPIVEEEPFLAMRLFQLGLTEWAKNNSDATNLRNQLRTWEFGYDKGPITNIPFTDRSFARQGFASFIDGRIIGDDIVVLKAKKMVNKVTESFFNHPQTKTASGGFTLDKPGLFFDQINVKSAFKTRLGEADIFTALKGNTPLWVEHSNQWPKKYTQNTRLISRPGFWIDSEDQFGARNIPNICGDKPHHIFHVVGMSVDIKHGSSGGTVLAPDIEQVFESPEVVAQQLVGIGVATGAKWDASKYNHDEWDNAGPVPLQVDNGYDGQNVNWFTGIVNPSFLRRDGPDKVKTHKDDPKVCKRGERQGCVPCRRYNASDKCIELAYEPSSLTSTGNGNISNDPFRSKGIKEDDNKSARPETKERLIRCKYKADMSPQLVNGRKEVIPGMMIGIMGASASQSRYIGDFQLICAPLSSLSYTENWRYLHNKGAGPSWYLSLLRGSRGWGNLATHMHDRFIQYTKAPKGQMVKPVPMKFCPPNYLMNGISVKTDGKGITGVVSLECRKPINEIMRQNADGADQISVYLDASESGVDGYTFYGNDYSLDQRIGNPSRRTRFDEKISKISCGDYVLSGVEMTHNGKGEMVHFKPECTPYKL